VDRAQIELEEREGWRMVHRQADLHTLKDAPR
jgi:hypothetical protein